VDFIGLSKQQRKERITSVLRYLVVRNGYSQRSLAKQLGIHRSKVGHILTGEISLQLTELVDWLEVLEVSNEEFFAWLDTGVGLEDDWK